MEAHGCSPTDAWAHTRYRYTKVCACNMSREFRVYYSVQSLFCMTSDRVRPYCLLSPRRSTCFSRHDPYPHIIGNPQDVAPGDHRPHTMDDSANPRSAPIIETRICRKRHLFGCLCACAVTCLGNVYSTLDARTLITTVVLVCLSLYTVCFALLVYIVFD